MVPEERFFDWGFRLGLRTLRRFRVERLIERLKLFARKKHQRGGERQRQQDKSCGEELFLKPLFLSDAHGTFMHRAGFLYGWQAVGWQFV